MALNESEVIELLSGIFATRDQRLHIGIGDDAAVVAGFAQQILTTDIAVEGVHFPHLVDAAAARAVAG